MTTDVTCGKIRTGQIGALSTSLSCKAAMLVLPWHTNMRLDWILNDTVLLGGPLMNRLLAFHSEWSPPSQKKKKMQSNPFNHTSPFFCHCYQYDIFGHFCCCVDNQLNEQFINRFKAHSQILCGAGCRHPPTPLSTKKLLVLELVGRRHYTPL